MAIEVTPRLAPGVELESARAEALQEWEALAPGRKAQQRYDTHLFPLACEAMRRIGGAGPAAEVAFVPVGTQPYSPILAALANPARVTLLLHTEGSRTHCDQVREALANEPLHLEPRPIGDGTDGHRIARVVHGELVAAGLPAAEHVVVDVTSGRKATVAVLGAIAAVRGFRQGYIEGSPSRRHPSLFVNERYVAVTNVRAYFHDEERATALAFLKIADFAAASRILKEIGRRSTPAGAASPLSGDHRAPARPTPSGQPSPPILRRDGGSSPSLPPTSLSTSLPSPSMTPGRPLATCHDREKSSVPAARNIRPCWRRMTGATSSAGPIFSKL